MKKHLSLYSTDRASDPEIMCRILVFSRTTYLRAKMYCPEFPNEKRTFTAKKYDTLLCIVTRAVQVEMSAYFRHFFFEIVIQRHSLHRTRCSCWMTPPGNQKKTVLYHIRCAGTSRSSASIRLYVS